MPVQVFPSPIKALPVKARFTKDARYLLQELRPDLQRKPLQTSFNDEEEFPPNLIRANNGLVDTAVEAYNNEHHLHIRPEDIWFAILTQFSLYVKSHAEELRSKFVTHSGKKELTLRYPTLHDSHDFDFSVFARDMGVLLENEVTDPDLRNWMMPAFTTTTDQDIIVASIIMMGTLEKYFTYICKSGCGLPSATLHGEKSDYVKILQRLDKLESFGREPAAFATLLRPVLNGLIRTFENPTGKQTIDFWRQIVDINRGSGFHRYSGWIVAFCFWNDKGRCLHPVVRNAKASTNLDGIRLHKIEKDDVPPGWTTAPVRVQADFRTFDTVMLAGSVCIACSSAEYEGDWDTVQPVMAWAMYETNAS